MREFSGQQFELRATRAGVIFAQRNQGFITQQRTGSYCFAVSTLTDSNQVSESMIRGSRVVGFAEKSRRCDRGLPASALGTPCRCPGLCCRPCDLVALVARPACPQEQSK